MHAVGLPTYCFLSLQ